MQRGRLDRLESDLNFAVNYSAQLSCLNYALDTIEPYGGDYFVFIRHFIHIHDFTLCRSDIAT